MANSWNRLVGEQIQRIQTRSYKKQKLHQELKIHNKVKMTHRGIQNTGCLAMSADSVQCTVFFYQVSLVARAYMVHMSCSVNMKLG